MLISSFHFLMIAAGVNNMHLAFLQWTCSDGDITEHVVSYNRVHKMGFRIKLYAELVKVVRNLGTVVGNGIHNLDYDRSIWDLCKR